MESNCIQPIEKTLRYISESIKSNPNGAKEVAEDLLEDIEKGRIVISYNSDLNVMY